jgi:hypothetical protein
VCLLLQLSKWFTWLVLPAFLFTAVFWVTRLNKVSDKHQAGTTKGSIGSISSRSSRSRCAI